MFKFSFIFLYAVISCGFSADEEREGELRKLEPRDAFEFPRPGYAFTYPHEMGPPHHHFGPHRGGPDHQHHHYHDIPDSSIDGTLDDHTNSSDGIPLDFAKLLNEHIESDNLMSIVEDKPPEFPLVSTRFGADDSNNTERNAAQVARAAKCIPELTTVRLVESNDPNVFYIPECTRVERCGGCCSHNLLACQPTATETIVFSVQKTVYHNKKLKYAGKEAVTTEKHTKCKCGCKVQAKDCNEYQEYDEAGCRCTCKNIDDERKCYKNGHTKLWNPDVCACQCRDVLPCSTGNVFDQNSCRCIKNQLERRYILPDTRKEQSDHFR